ncbi:hypothetical protein [Bacillus sp. NPDC057893]|uniref:hypothetical protein n=1 Tax=Bacillus sp. NPDC057893 TaxID=3346273 RepID=UPI00366C1974
MNPLQGYYVEIDTKKRTAKVVHVPLGFNFKAMLEYQLGAWTEEVMSVKGVKIAVVWNDTIKGKYRTLKVSNEGKEMFGKVFLIEKSDNDYITTSKEIAEEAEKLWKQTLLSLKAQDEDEE